MWTHARSSWARFACSVAASASSGQDFDCPSTCLQVDQYSQCEVLSGRTADTADLHPILASMYRAANFAASDSTTATQAAGVVELLCALLHPTPQKRLATNFVTKIRFPWLFATFKDEMPACPVAL